MSGVLSTGLSRRGLVAGATMFGLSSALSSPAHAKHPIQQALAPAYYRFMFGGLEMTLVSDGPIASGDPTKTFRGAAPDEIARKIDSSFLAQGRLDFEQNILVINTGDRLIMFDTGTGSLKAFGPRSGQLLTNLRAAGIDPASIDDIVITHGHADHINGLMADDGARNFPNAQLYMNQVDFDFWIDAQKVGPGMKIFYDCAIKHLVPNRDRIKFIKDGEQFLPGIQAMVVPGHTVGLMVFILTSGDKTMVHITDAARHHILNVETPRWEFVGDTDPAMAVTSRLKLFDMITTTKTPIISYHYPWPGVGHLARWNDGFRYYPAPMVVGI